MDDKKSDDLKGFVTWTHKQPDDYEGVVVCTLIGREDSADEKEAVLYVHGFNDYFFQEGLAEFFEGHGKAFYALDLRKYGRSYRTHQGFNDVRDLKEYDADIFWALDFIKRRGHAYQLLMGHSTGGLVLSYFIGRNPLDTVRGLILNSPFFDFNFPHWFKASLLPIANVLASAFPKLRVPSGLPPFYGYSLHCDHFGEWQYNTAWKPHRVPPVRLSFVRAIHLAQQELRKAWRISCPCLVVHSDKSVLASRWDDGLLESDGVLNVDDIRKGAMLLEGNVSCVSIPGGMHDLVLSKTEVRSMVYAEMKAWMEDKLK